MTDCDPLNAGDLMLVSVLLRLKLSRILDEFLSPGGTSDGRPDRSGRLVHYRGMGASGMTVLPTSGPVELDARAPAAAEALGSAQVQALFESHYESIWRLLRRLGVPERSADDAAQQVFLILAERRELVRAGSERAFLYGTALRLASSLRRVALREVLSEDFDERHSAGAGPDELADQKRARDLLDVVLARLDGDLLRVFALYELEDFTLPEIAELLAIPLGTATSRLRRSREQFRAQLAQVTRELAARQAEKSRRGAER